MFQQNPAESDDDGRATWVEPASGPPDDAPAVVPLELSAPALDSELASTGDVVTDVTGIDENPSLVSRLSSPAQPGSAQALAPATTKLPRMRSR
ncbi:hypothetical protein [Nannocystis sp.]|uniref:hypothetical protein n=1 Tax=Nannocystis sp. TaxID=1962667 RepID=UPI0024284987|nr:hypothetical protein [Nannocystis sp.]MBK7829215.1 hypothetical protein [Nannocystis sp.]MBK9751984.1 hypothetical protein [Nannocystis sp.]